MCTWRGWRRTRTVSRGSLPRAFWRSCAAASAVPGSGATRRVVECVASPARAEELVQQLLASVASVERLNLDGVVTALDGPAVALDCEGVRLGRFGRVATLQLALPDGASFLFDALQPGLVTAVAPLLESRAVVKVIHDCREDSAAFYHQHGVHLRAVFDTQAAYAALLRATGLFAYQASMAELLQIKLGVANMPEVADMKIRMLADPQLWARRPLSSLLVRYALHGVDQLLPLRTHLLQEAGAHASPTTKGSLSVESEFSHASERAVNYCLLNKDFSSAQSMAKIGTRLWAVVATRTESGIIFKLNAGRMGVCSTPSALKRFSDVEQSDVVLCCVSGVSLNGKYIYLDRYDHDWDYFDHQLRPSHVPEAGLGAREHRHETLRPSDAGPLGAGADAAGGNASLLADPLIVRGLPAENPSFTGVGGADGDFDAWDASAEDVGLSDAEAY